MPNAEVHYATLSVLAASTAHVMSADRRGGEPVV